MASKKDLEKRLNAVYQQAIADVEEELDKYCNGWDEYTIGKDGEEKIIHHKGMYERKAEEFASGAYDEKQFNEWWAAQEGRRDHWIRLRDQLAEQMTHTNEMACDIINGKLPKEFADGSNELVQVVMDEADLQGIIGLNFELVDDQTVRIILERDDIMPFTMTKIDPEKDIPWNTERLQNALATGIAKGDSFEQIVARFQAVANMSRVAAIRNARTAITAARNAGKMDRYAEMKRRGVTMTKIWHDIHDSIPPEREAHWEASGQEVPYEKPFVVGGELLMYPGDRSMGASGWNVYNCRCSMRAGNITFSSILPRERQGKIKVTYNG